MPELLVVVVGVCHAVADHSIFLGDEGAADDGLVLLDVVLVAGVDLASSTKADLDTIDVVPPAELHLAVRGHIAITWPKHSTRLRPHQDLPRETQNQPDNHPVDPTDSGQQQMRPEVSASLLWYCMNLSGIFIVP